MPSLYGIKDLSGIESSYHLFSVRIYKFIFTVAFDRLYKLLGGSYLEVEITEGIIIFLRFNKL